MTDKNLDDDIMKNILKKLSFLEPYPFYQFYKNETLISIFLI